MNVEAADIEEEEADDLINQQPGESNNSCFVALRVVLVLLRWDAAVNDMRV